MKLTKTITLAALVAAGLLAGTALQAQDAPKDKPAAAPGGPGMRGRPNIEQFAKEFNLTEDQKTKVKAAMDDRMEKAKQIRNDTTLSQEDRRAKMKEAQEAFTAKLKEILTADQFEKWQKQVQAQRNRPPQAGGDKPAAGADKAPKKD
jgi:Spy/CpxP family protein refolding chaperone